MMIRKKITGILTLTFLLMLSPAVEAQEWLTEEGDNYSMEYPSKWNLDKSGLMGSKFFVMAPKNSEGDVFQENVNLIVQPLGGQDMSLEFFASLSEQQLQKLLNDCQILSSSTLDMEGQKYHRMEFTGTQGVLKLHMLQYYFVENDKAFVLTFTSEDSKFKENLALAEHMLNSFSIR